MQITRNEVKSSNIAEVGHNPESATLEVMFKSGDVYRYEDVPAEVVAELLASESLGKQMNISIKGHYDCWKRGVRNDGGWAAGHALPAVVVALDGDVHLLAE